MEVAAVVKASIISKALPYFQKYRGKIVVVKYGGNAMKNETLKENVMSDIVLLSEVGVKVVLVHGGGPDINKMLAKTGIESKFIQGLRYTDEATMDIVQMVLAGKTNKDLVALINQKGAKAVGICGMDANLLEASKIDSDVELGYVGKIDHVNGDIIMEMLDAGYIPVVASLGCDHEGHTYNINADSAASSIASALHAENMILVSDIPGVLENPSDENSLISCIYLDDVAKLQAKGIISGGMIPKVECCVNAITNQVSKAVIIDGRIPHSILIEMFSCEGIGTMFKIKEA